ncbi:unnamed protein product [Dicrocoelium dendriticum]|nr:unnamed protein product [Dicrocoelium dendriticum]
MERRLHEVTCILRGLGKILNASLDSQLQELSWAWRVSTVRQSLFESLSSCSNPPSTADIRNCASYLVDRTKLICEQNTIILRRLLISYTASNPSESMANSSDFGDTSHTSLVVPHSISTPTESGKLSSPDALFDGGEKSPNQQNGRADPFPLSNLPDALVNPTSKQLDTAKERRVPSSRIGRVVGFGNLVVGLGLSAATEWTKRKVGFSGSSKDSPEEHNNPFLTDENLERIVDTLCRMRGAALKLGQLLSIQAH